MNKHDQGPTPSLRDEQLDEEGLVMFLEPDQLVTDKSRPVPRAHLTAQASFWLWALRVFVLVVSAMVIYTFFAQLGS
jgi:hypothetical protein